MCGFIGHYRALYFLELADTPEGWISALKDSYEKSPAREADMPF